MPVTTSASAALAPQSRARPPRAGSTARSAAANDCPWSAAFPAGNRGPLVPLCRGRLCRGVGSRRCWGGVAGGLHREQLRIAATAVISGRARLMRNLFTGRCLGLGGAHAGFPSGRVPLNGRSGRTGPVRHLHPSSWPRAHRSVRRAPKVAGPRGFELHPNDVGVSRRERAHTSTPLLMARPGASLVSMTERTLAFAVGSLNWPW